MRPALNRLRLRAEAGGDVWDVVGVLGLPANGLDLVLMAGGTFPRVWPDLLAACPAARAACASAPGEGPGAGAEPSFIE
jgi:hypothetical protein